MSVPSLWSSESGTPSQSQFQKLPLWYHLRWTATKFLIRSFINLTHSARIPSMLGTEVQLWVPTSEYSRDNDTPSQIQSHVHYSSKIPCLPSDFPPRNVGALFEPHFARSDRDLEEKMARKRYFTMKRATQELAIDSDSDMEPEDNDFCLFVCFCQMVMVLSLKVATKPC